MRTTHLVALSAVLVVPVATVGADAAPTQPGTGVSPLEVTQMQPAANDDLRGFVHPPVRFSPGVEHGSEARKYQGIPSIERAPGGRLWAVWYAGKVHEDRYNYVVAATSGDHGRTWSDIKFVIDPDGDGPMRTSDPCFWLDPSGTLWLFWWLNGPGRLATVTLAMTTANPDDENPAWSEPRVVCNGVMLNKPIVARNGDWLLPTAIWHRDNSNRVVASSDQGRTWTLRGAANVPDPADRDCDEPMLAERSDGSLLMLVRARYGIGRSVSADGGRTWPPVETYLPDATARFFFRRLASGNLLLVKHGALDTKVSRTHLTAYLSADDGATWQGGLLLDERASVSYPDGTQAPDGAIYVIYDWNRADEKHILMATFTEQDVLAGKPVSAAARFRVLINQATGVNPKPWLKDGRFLKLKRNADGASFLSTPVAVLEPVAGEVRTLRPGTRIFSDRDHEFGGLPECLSGRQFVFGSMNGGRVTCRTGGVVYVVTPVPERNPESAAGVVLGQGFVKAAVPESVLFRTAAGHAVSANVVTVFQKLMQPGETLEIGKWGVIVFGDQVREPVLTGPGAVLECADAGSRISWFRQDRRPFTDRDYRVIAPPPPLGKAMMLQSSITGGMVTCRRGGVVYVVTPSPNHGAVSQATRLTALGFTRADVDEFQLFEGGRRDICAVYQKQMPAGDVLELGNWSLVLLPADGAIEFADTATHAELSLGPSAAIQVSEGQAAALVAGARLFSDREHRLATLPGELAGCSFLQRDMGRLWFTCIAPGIVYVITPLNRVDGAESLHGDLVLAGFERTRVPVFQAFGDTPTTRCAVYQKTLAVGEKFRMGKWGVLAVPGTLDLRVVAPPAPTAWPENRGELLYNGIRLPEEWPPLTINMSGNDPAPVPYLDARPDIAPIDLGRQLFVDDFLVEETTLTRTFHVPEKYVGNPVLEPRTPLEHNGEFNSAAVPKSGGLWWDPAEKIFKMWYEAGWIGTICYATSTDGLRWQRPALDVVPGTNQVLPPDLLPDSWTVVPDWDAKDPQRRYTMRLQPPGATQSGWCMTSADGIHWTHRAPTGTAGDRSTHFYNPFRKKWVHSIRSGGRGRARQYWESDDFLAGAVWSEGEPAPWAMADRLDLPDPDLNTRTQLYNLDAVAYESIMLGLFEIHRGPENNHCEKVGLPKITELSFAYSRDGFHWHRPDRRAHIPAERRDTWDRGYVQSLGNICTIRGDKLWIYYTGFRGDANRRDRHWLRNGMYDRGATGVAFLRRDGFASMQAGEEPGTLTTRPVTFSGTRLFVNADVPGGALRVEVLDKDRNPIAPFTLANSVPYTGDSTLQAMTWKDGADLSALQGKPVRFRFSLRRGALYAFWVSRDDSGRSDGYVAGGGPGYPGHRDTVGCAALAAERELAVNVCTEPTPLVPEGWDPVRAADAVLERLVTVTAPQIKGAHDAEMVLVDGRAFIVAEVNDDKAGESAGWPFIYCAMSVVNLKTMTVEKVIPFARGGQVFTNETLPEGACFVPRILLKYGKTIRCFFASEAPGKRQAQTWFIDFDIERMAFADTIHRARLKTAAGTFDMQPCAFHEDAARQGFKRPAKDFGLYIFSAFKYYRGRTYVALNNFPGGQNALAELNEAGDTFEVLGHFNEPQDVKLTESAVERLPDGTWMAICRQDGGNCNYHFTTSRDGKTWTRGEELPCVPNGASSKPTFDCFGGVYYLGWQEARSIDGASRSVFNVDVSRNGKTWARKYQFETPKSFQYPAFHEYDGNIWVCVTQGDSSPSRKERIVFGMLEDAAGKAVSGSRIHRRKHQ